MRRFKFSSSSLSRYLIAPANGAAQVVVWDTDCRGLGAYRGKTGPGTYFVHFRVNGRQRKFTLGRINELAIPDARGRTVEIMAAAHQGRDVVEEREAADRARLTLADAFAEYTKALRRKLDFGHSGGQPNGLR